MSYSVRKPDLLDKSVAFLAKRDGIDKTLKIIRYAARVVLATALEGSDGEAALRLRRFESSIGTSRKAYRLGKFLGDVNTIRKTPLRAPYALLEWIAAGGEGVYYFIDQLQWLVKTGVLPERYSRHLALASAYGELVGYVGSVSLGVLRMNALLEREVALLGELRRRQKLGQSDEADKPLLQEIRLLRARRALRTLGLAQDLADSLLALSDLRQDRKTWLNHAALLSLAGLLSGCISAYKNWPGVQR